MEDPKQPETVAVNIKLRRKQRDWLAQTARKIRHNSLSPLLASERVYPQHLISVAVELLMASDVDWATVETLSHLRTELGLSEKSD